eukprot:4693531-Amphidinium_carterae.1
MEMSLTMSTVGCDYIFLLANCQLRAGTRINQKGTTCLFQTYIKFSLSWTKYNNPPKVNIIVTYWKQKLQCIAEKT